MDRPALERWLAAYERAWRSPGIDQLADLFTADASYMNAPFQEPFRGLDAIAAMWEEERDGHDEGFEMDSEVLAVEGDVGVARLEVRYEGPPPIVYRDLWVVTLGEDGRCSAFEEWPFSPDDQPAQQ